MRRTQRPLLAVAGFAEEGRGPEARMQQPPETGEGKETGFPPEPLQKNAALPHLNFSLVGPMADF